MPAGAAVKNLLPRRAVTFLQTLQSLDPPARRFYVRAALLRLLRLRSDRLPMGAVRVRTLLFVCHGNILRSPMAAALYSRESDSDQDKQQTVLSAGLLPSTGRPADPRGCAAAEAHGISLHDHRSQTVSAELVNQADLIIIMDRANEARLLTRFPSAGPKVALLGIFAPEDGDPVIPDPYSDSAQGVVACYARLERAVGGLSAALRRRPPVPPKPIGPLKGFARAALTHPWVLAGGEAASRGYAAVFLLHRFSRSDRGDRTVSVESLRQNLAWLRRRRYNLAPLGDLIAASQDGTPVPPRTVAFTVDDGYADFAELAAPVFAEFDCPATVFLVTDFVDGHRWLWWDRLRYAFEHSARRELTIVLAGEPCETTWRDTMERSRTVARLIEAVKWHPARQRDAMIDDATRQLEVEIPTHPPVADAPMTWDTVRRLAGAGISFGPHSCSHPIHSLEDAETSRREIATSWQRLRMEVPGALPVYCFPNGDERSFGEREGGYISELGLLAGVSAKPGSFRLRARDGEHGKPIPRYTLDADLVRFKQMASGIERLKLRWRP